MHQARTCRTTAEERNRALPFSGLGTNLESAQAYSLLLTLEEKNVDSQAGSRRPMDSPFVLGGFMLLTMLSRETRGR